MQQAEILTPSIPKNAAALEEADEGPVRLKFGSPPPERLCIASRVSRPITELIRFVRGPDGTLVPDIRNKLPGRGCWVRGDRASLELAIKRKAFSRALKGDVTLPADLVARVESLLMQDALQTLSLANKAGGVVVGFAKIEAARGAILALVQAVDGSSPEILRLQGLCRARGRRGMPPKSISLFNAAQLALSLGYEHVIHAALMDKDAGEAFLSRALRAAVFQAGNPPEQHPVS